MTYSRLVSMEEEDGRQQDKVNADEIKEIANTGNSSEKADYMDKNSICKRWNPI